MIKLHHSAYKITKGNLEKVLDMFKLLGCEITYRPDSEHQWAMVGQPGLAYDIQIVEYDEEPNLKNENRQGTHVAFVSDHPSEDIDKIEVWAKETGLQFTQNKWSDKELYFDLPEIFINFVIEVMHTSVEED